MRNAILGLLALAIATASACKEQAPLPSAGSSCMRVEKGTCEEWVQPPAGAKDVCDRDHGAWTTGCLTLDAVGNCVVGGTQQLFYSKSKFDEAQARADCASRPSSQFSSGDKPRLREAKK